MRSHQMPRKVWEYVDTFGLILVVLSAPTFAFLGALDSTQHDWLGLAGALSVVAVNVATLILVVLDRQRLSALFRIMGGA